MELRRRCWHNVGKKTRKRCALRRISPAVRSRPSIQCPSRSHAKATSLQSQKGKTEKWMTGKYTRVANGFLIPSIIRLSIVNSFASFAPLREDCSSLRGGRASFSKNVPKWDISCHACSFLREFVGPNGTLHSAKRRQTGDFRCQSSAISAKFDTLQGKKRTSGNFGPDSTASGNLTRSLRRLGELAAGSVISCKVSIMMSSSHFADLIIVARC